MSTLKETNYFASQNSYRQSTSMASSRAMRNYIKDLVDLHEDISESVDEKNLHVIQAEVHNSEQVPSNAATQNNSTTTTVITTAMGKNNTVIYSHLGQMLTTPRVVPTSCTITPELAMSFAFTNIAGTWPDFFNSNNQNNPLSFHIKVYKKRLTTG